MAARIGKATRNKRVELEANSVNAIGLAIFLGGFLQPFLQSGWTAATVVQFFFSAIIFLLLHLWAKAILGALED